MVYGRTAEKLDLPTATKRGKQREFHCRKKRQTFFFDLSLHKNIACCLKQTHAKKYAIEKSPQTGSLNNNNLVNRTLNRPMDKKLATNLSFFSSNPVKQNNTPLPVQSFHSRPGKTYTTWQSLRFPGANLQFNYTDRKDSEKTDVSVAIKIIKSSSCGQNIESFSRG